MVGSFFVMQTTNTGINPIIIWSKTWDEPEDGNNKKETTYKIYVSPACVDGIIPKGKFYLGV